MDNTKGLAGRHRLCQIARMLRVRMLTGEVVASIPVMELSDVMALKKQLHCQHSLPTRFRQRLFHEGTPLQDSATLDSPLDLDLVLLPYEEAQTRADELVTATENGFAAEVRETLKPSIGFNKLGVPISWVDLLDKPTLRSRLKSCFSGH